jgi:tetratricopeptide (TPR) repeat protein
MGSARRVGLIAAVVGLVFWATITASQKPKVDARALLNSAREQLALGVFDEAERIAVQAVTADPKLTFAWIVAGESAMHQNAHARSLAHFSQVPPEARHELIPRAKFGEAVAAFELRQFGRAERCLRQALSNQPDWYEARLRLSQLLGWTGRLWEQTPQLLMLVRNRQYQFDLLLLLVERTSTVDPTEWLEQSTLVEPTSPFAWLGLGCAAMEMHQLEQAGTFFRQARMLLPGHPEIEVRYGEWLLEYRPEEFADWHRNVSPAVEQHPRLWLIRARWADHRQDRPAAIRCFWEALCRDPDDIAANRRVGELLTALGRRGDAEPYLARADRLDELLRIVREFHVSHPGPDAANRVVELLESCGRFWEARAWSTQAVERHPHGPWMGPTFPRSEFELEPGSPQSSSAFLPTVTIPLGRYPLPKIGGQPITQGELDHVAPRIPETIRFIDVAAGIGADFSYSSAPVDSPANNRIFDSTGGGVAVFDFDLDGECDLYFTQGGAYPFEPTRQLKTDRFFQGRQRQLVRDITLETGLADVDFGQGVSAGDFDNDGLADLYVGNLGVNRLWHNLGDGTYLAQPLPGMESHWSTSVLVADLDGDGVPDLFDSGYCAGTQILTSQCPTQGTRTVCSPHAFPAAADRIWRGLGDGTFEQLHAPALSRPDGYGLALLLADCDGDRRLELLLADDEVRTAFVRVRGAPFAPPRVEYDDRSPLPAGRGMAYGDVNGDDRPDLLLSTQGPVPWTLFSSQASAEPARPTPLDPHPREELAGFGAQFLDVDLDGRLDAVITTGESSPLLSLSPSSDMPPRLYWNAGEGQFLAAGTGVGEFFSTRRAGRGLARLDWNRDGLADFVVSHINSPAALVVNRSVPVGKPLVLSLVATRSARDGLGANVTVTAANTRRQQQLIGGDGYQTTNERVLFFALPKSVGAATVKVAWPSGSTGEVTLDSAVQSARIIEGRAEAVPLQTSAD